MENPEIQTQDQQTPETMVNPYLEDLKALQDEYRKHAAKTMNWKPPGFSHLKREFRRERNRQARISRRINRQRAKGN